MPSFTDGPPSQLAMVRQRRSMGATLTPAQPLKHAVQRGAGPTRAPRAHYVVLPELAAHEPLCGLCEVRKMGSSTPVDVQRFERGATANAGRHSGWRAQKAC